MIRVLVLLALACLTSACGPFWTLHPIDVAVDNAGNAHFAVGQGRVWETKRGAAERIVYGKSTISESGSTTTWKVESITTPKARSEDGILKLALDGEGRPLIAQEREQGLALFVRNATRGTWAEAGVAGALGAASRDVLQQSARIGIGGLWRTTNGGDVMLLADRYLYRVHDANVVDAIDTGRPCTQHDGCLFDPTEDRAGTALIAANVGGTLLALHCEESTCAWTPDESLRLPTKGVPYSRTSTIFFHTSDRLPLLVRSIYATDKPADNGLIALTTPSGQADLSTRAVYHVGAAPRRGGGVAIVTLTYAGALSLHLLRDGAPTRTIDLGSFITGLPKDPIAIADHERAGVEKVDVLLAKASDTIAHFRIDVATGRIAHTTISVGEP